MFGCLKYESQQLMIISEALSILQRVIAPTPIDEFFNETLGRRVMKIAGSGQGYRATLLGAEPERLILNAFPDLAPRIGFHAAAPLGPPPPIEAVSSASAFKAKIEAFHARGYTVRLPKLNALSGDLSRFVRALELVLQQPVAAEAFWSRSDAKAPVHHDDYDIMAIQLKGHKRWFVSTERSDLPNKWKMIPTGPERLTEHTMVELGPGDLLYLPRGTPHRVDAITDSLHLSIGFIPLTMREAIAATLDHLSDLDRSFRESVNGTFAVSIRNNDLETLMPKIRAGVARLLMLCRSDNFIAEALQRRSSRMIGDLEKLKPSPHHAKISRDSLMRHNPQAICHLMGNEEKIDFSFPGGHIYVHKGVEQSLKFIADTPEFRVRDIPGMIDDDIRCALVSKLLASGFLNAGVN